MIPEATYYVHFLKPGEMVEPADRAAITQANFNVYNLITLFLHQDEIAALADLINPKHFNDNELSDLAVQTGKPLTYRFYVTGPIGVGKTTTANQLQNLTVLDEWMAPRLEILAKPWDTLTETEKRTADTWIINQFRLKNDALRHARMGIFIVDRPPLDPLVFTPPPERQAKAKALLDAMCPGGSWQVAGGTVLRLIGNPEELSVRVLATGRDKYTPDKLRQMQGDLDTVYGTDGYTRLDSRGMSICEVTKRVAHIIHFDDYKEYNLDARLKQFRDTAAAT